MCEELGIDRKRFMAIRHQALGFMQTRSHMVAFHDRTQQIVEAFENGEAYEKELDSSVLDVMTQKEYLEQEEYEQLLRRRVAKTSSLFGIRPEYVVNAVVWYRSFCLIQQLEPDLTRKRFKMYWDVADRSTNPACDIIKEQRQKMWGLLREACILNYKSHQFHHSRSTKHISSWHRDTIAMITSMISSTPVEACDHGPDILFSNDITILEGGTTKSGRWFQLMSLYGSIINHHNQESCQSRFIKRVQRMLSKYGPGFIIFRHGFTEDLQSAYDEATNHRVKLLDLAGITFRNAKRTIDSVDEPNVQRMEESKW